MKHWIYISHLRSEEFIVLISIVVRRGNEYTHSYGATSKEGSFTPYIADAFNRAVRECILDGEMLVYNTKTKCLGKCKTKNEGKMIKMVLK